MVVVADTVAGRVAVVGRVGGLHFRQEQVQLHDVVDSRQGQERDHSLLVNLVTPPPGGRNEFGIHQELPKVVPAPVLEEGMPLLRRKDPIVGGSRGLEWLPVVIDAEAKSFLAIDAEANHPVNGKESTDGTLVLITDSAAGAHRAAGVLLEKVEVELWKSAEVLVELVHGIFGVKHATGHLPDRAPVGLPAVEGVPECWAWRPFRHDVEADLYVSESLGRHRRQWHTLDEPLGLVVR
mmetsp:Transcript_96449/g.281875  ORF Transcript_96449/g.281875 Transcript_96449/m.281875 type:complete len:237 (+) Transcript_96449:1129-1839(+)